MLRSALVICRPSKVTTNLLTADTVYMMWGEVSEGGWQDEEERDSETEKEREELGDLFLFSASFHHTSFPSFFHLLVLPFIDTKQQPHQSSQGGESVYVCVCVSSHTLTNVNHVLSHIGDS